MVSASSIARRAGIPIEATREPHVRRRLPDAQAADEGLPSPDEILIAFRSLQLGDHLPRVIPQHLL